MYVVMYVCVCMYVCVFSYVFLCVCMLVCVADVCIESSPNHGTHYKAKSQPENIFRSELVSTNVRSQQRNARA